MKESGIYQKAKGFPVRQRNVFCDVGVLREFLGNKKGREKNMIFPEGLSGI